MVGYAQKQGTIFDCTILSHVPDFVQLRKGALRVRAVPVLTESEKPPYLFVSAAFPDAKPLRTFAGNALALAARTPYSSATERAGRRL
jgi:hypothetical protein